MLLWKFLKTTLLFVARARCLCPSTGEIHLTHCLLQHHRDEAEEHRHYQDTHHCGSHGWELPGQFMAWGIIESWGKWSGHHPGNRDRWPNCYESGIKIPSVYDRTTINPLNSLKGEHDYGQQQPTIYHRVILPACVWRERRAEKVGQDGRIVFLRSTKICVYF